MNFVTRLALSAVLLTSAIAIPAVHPTPVHAQGSCPGQNVAVGVDYMGASKTTDGVNTPFGKINPTDEVFFTGGGVKLDGNGNSIPVDVPKSAQIKFKNGRAYDPLYVAATPHVCLANGESVAFTVVVREDDDFDVQDLGHVLVAGAAALGIAITGEAGVLGPIAVAEAKRGAKDLVRQLDKGPDDTIGAFVVIIKNDGGQMRYNWQTVDHARMTMSRDWEGAAYEELQDQREVAFKMTGGDSRYYLSVSIWEPPSQ